MDGGYYLLHRLSARQRKRDMDAEGLDAPDGPNLREVPDAAKGLADLFEVNARSCADDPLKTLRSSRRPEPAKRPLSVYCQNVKRFQPPNRRGLGTR